MIYKFECEDNYGTTLEVKMGHSDDDESKPMLELYMELPNEPTTITLKLGIKEATYLRGAINDILFQHSEQTSKKILSA
jgi:hypothetical protein